MTGWLIDTNVLSAFAPRRAPIAPNVAAWFEKHSDSLFLSAITAAEIDAGIARLRRTGATARADALDAWFESILSFYADRVLPFDLAAARQAGVLGDLAQAQGRHPGFADVAIAAIARACGLVILTLNARHFEPLGVASLNPFASG